MTDRTAASRGGPISLCGIPLAHPVINASGTFDAIAARRAFGDALLARFPFAAFVSKTVTVEPREGNPPPRLWELPGGMLNSIGLPNKGLEGYLAHDLPGARAAAGPADRQRHGLHPRAGRDARRGVGEREEVAGLELNVSCPNVETGMIMGADPGETARAGRHRASADAQAVDREADAELHLAGRGRRRRRGAGADAVSLVNTLRGMAFHPRRPRERWLGGGTGGMSGPAVRAIALAQIAEVRARVGIPIVGMGGVQNGRHASDLLQAGADVVAVGTESFRDPFAGARVASELAEIPANSGVSGHRCAQSRAHST